MLNSLWLLMPYLLVLMSLGAWAALIFKEESSSHKIRWVVGLFLLAAVLIASYVFRISFYHDGLDALFVVALMFTGPLLLISRSRFRSRWSRILVFGVGPSLALSICFFGFVSYIFRPSVEAVKQSTETKGAWVKIYTTGGATTACNYQVETTIYRYLLLEREVSCKKTLLTTGDSRCRSFVDRIRVQPLSG